MRFLLAILLTLTALTTQAAMRGDPFLPHNDRRFDNIEAMTGDVTLSCSSFSQSSKIACTSTAGAASAGVAGLGFEHLAMAIWDTSVSSGGVVGTHSLGVALPAKALITQSWTYSITQPATASSGTVAFQCEDANNILTASDVSGYTAGTVTTGASTGSAATMVAGISASCNISAVVATGAMSAGKLAVFVRYVVTP